MAKKYSFKILQVTDGYLLAAKGYSVSKGSLDGKKLSSVGEIDDNKFKLVSKCRFFRRLLRAEIVHLYGLSNNDYIALAKKGLFAKRENGDAIKKVFSLPRGSKPLNICTLPNGHVYFGEYFQNMEKEAVNIYGSTDNGETWKVFYTFPAGNINHVHGLFYDKYTGRMWFLTGDRDNECIIGYTEDEFKTAKEVLRGGQEYRSCQLFFYPDFIVYATDSQYTQNEIRKIDRKTLEITTLAKVQGSVIKGGQCGDVSFLSTTVEPSDVNKDRFAHIWVTKDGRHWEDVYKAEKDGWPSIFQFGTFEFPEYQVEKVDRLYFSGRALKGLDGKTIYIEL